MEIRKTAGIVLALTGICGILTANAKRDESKVQVLKNKNDVYIRSYFSPARDVVVRVATGRNGHINFRSAGLVDSDAPMDLRTCRRPQIIHNCGDDATPWNFNNTYIGGNHGCSDAFEITSKEHGLTNTELGTEWTDGKGRKFYLIKIIDPDRVWALSENIGKGDIWNFHRRIFGKELKNKSGRKLRIDASKRTQIIPACRILKQAYLIDGKTPLPDGKAVTCDFIDIVDVYDIIAPDSLLEKIKKNPGKKVKFNTKGLDSVMTNDILYRFQPRGVCTVLHNSKANRKIKLGYMGFIQTAKLYQGKFDTHEYHIPKSVPFENNGIKYDFSGFQDYSKKLPEPLYFNRESKMISDPENLPDRWIQFLGNKENGKPVRKVGYAAGYSLIEGITRPEIRAKNVIRACFLYTSSKTYPSAIDKRINPVKAGQMFRCLAYRQYFDPSGLSKKASSSYLHKEGDSWVLYLHYHQPASQDIIKLPEQLTGKKISVVEKTPKVKLLSGNKVAKSGIKVSSPDARGYIVLKVD